MLAQVFRGACRWCSLGIFALSASCASKSQLASTEEVPAEWVRHDTPCNMSFLGPETLVEAQVQGEDSCVLELTGDNCNVSGGRGGYSSGLSMEGIGASESYGREMTTVDGRDASFVVATTEDTDRPFFAGVHVPLGTSAIGAISAELFVACDSVDARDSLMPLLRTLQIADSE
jgi:hypothetical protein